MAGQVHLELYIAHTGACWNTLPQSRERRGTGQEKEKRNREEHRRGWAASLGPIRGTHREKVITKCTGNDQNERTR